MLIHLSVVCLLLAIFATFVRYLNSRYYRLLKKIPGPSGLPLIGCPIDIVKNTPRLVEYGRQLQQKYGDTFAVCVGPYSGVIVTDPRDLEIVLNKTATLSKPLPYKVLELYMGYSLITANTRDWKKLHRIISPAFGLPTLKSFLPVFNEKSVILVEILRNHANGHSFDILNYMMMCTLDMVTKTSLGTDMNVMKSQRLKIVEGLRVAEDVIFHATIRPWCWFPSLMKSTSSYKALVNGVKGMWDYADEIIMQKLKHSVRENDSLKTKPDGEESEECHIAGKKHLGFLEHVISCLKDKSTSLNEIEIKDNTVTVIVGGMDTGSIAMSNILMLLGIHQDVQKRVVQELQQIFGEDANRHVTYDDLRQMVYLEQVINETLRLYPPLPFVARAVDEEVNLTKYTLPVGTYIAIPVAFVHRKSEYFPDPYKFDPDRFSPENSVNRHPYSFIPFLGGRRMCIGKKYAYMQMKTILSTILRNYEVLPCGNREDMEQFQFKLTLHMVNGHKVRLVPRKRVNF